MKKYLFLFSLLLTPLSHAQENWVTETASSYTVKHPNTWTVSTSETEGELGMGGPTPDFENSPNHLGTSLFISVTPPEHTNLDDAVEAYKKKLRETTFLKNIVIQQEKKIKFSGTDAVEIVFTAKIQHFSSACRIILFQNDSSYYEVSVTYDQALSKKLVKEAYKVIDSFEFSE